MNSTTLRSVPLGEHVRFSPSDSAPVWVRGHYDAASRCYSLTLSGDMNREAFRKGTTRVFTGFTW